MKKLAHSSKTKDVPIPEDALASPKAPGPPTIDREIRPRTPGPWVLKATSLEPGESFWVHGWENQIRHRLTNPNQWFVRNHPDRVLYIKQDVNGGCRVWRII